MATGLTVICNNAGYFLPLVTKVISDKNRWLIRKQLCISQSGKQTQRHSAKTSSAVHVCGVSSTMYKVKCINKIYKILS